MRAFFLKKECKGGENKNNLYPHPEKKTIKDRPQIDYYEKYLEISFSVAVEKDILDKNNNTTTSLNEKLRQRLKSQSSTTSDFGVGTPRKSLAKRSPSLKQFSYSFRRYVFKRSNAFSKTSATVSTRLID